ncbi:MAG: cytochrome d ubiquinol oxidase subunit II [Corynebacterium sp.]|uniref:cytochrome d ubiquinol oxidase subunit II n=1 Tax=Corynebacterium sp. TaxID=1720 RepID=UPI0026DAA3D0|nr:cytochrome d ubiquinol oxidase subunit II [Corynebacterium sp.]MDO5030686.1 cytochrome d ubiquinol oxidase subunit II [Corynebacterium sp.]
MFGVELPVLWFVLIAFLFAGYFLLEGFDFGVGMLLPFLGRDEPRRKAMLGTIGPVWDGNEVWLITAGGALFAAFPEWYASMFSGFYLPLFLILVALIVRVVGLEWRHKVNEERWRVWCDRAIILGSWLPPILWGVAVANLVRGVPLTADKTLDSGLGTLVGLLNPYALIGGIAFAAVFALHAVTFLRLKTAGKLRDEVGKAARIPALTAVIFGGAFLIWTQLSFGKPWLWAIVVIAVAGLTVAISATVSDRDGIAFTATAIAVVAITVTVFGAMYPYLMPTTLADGVSLDIWNSASNPYTLKIMTWSALAITPLVIAYQAWTYWVFRKRLMAERKV